MVSDWPPCANDCCETSNHDVPDANDNSTQMHGETSNLDGIRCKAFDFLRESLESQLNQRGGVVLRWEQGESDFMRVIDQQAKEARGKDVCFCANADYPCRNEMFSFARIDADTVELLAKYCLSSG